MICGNTIKMGVWAKLSVFCCWKRRKREKIDNWNFWFWFFCRKMAVSWRTSVFQKKPCWNPYFYSVLGCAFLGQGVKKREFWTPTKRRLTEKIVFGCFWCFSCFFFFRFFLWLLFFVFGGLKGQVRWPEGPPHLALNPLYFCLVFFCVFVFVFLVCFLFGGFKGHVRWPERQPHLALNPP